MRTLRKGQRYDELVLAQKKSCLLSYAMTKSICLKSPPNTTTFPPKGRLDFPYRKIEIHPRMIYQLFQSNVYESLELHPKLLVWPLISTQLKDFIDI